MTRARSIHPFPVAEDHAGCGPVDAGNLLSPAIRVLTGGDTANFDLVTEPVQTPDHVIARYVAVPSLTDPRALLTLETSAKAWRAALAPHANGAASRPARLIAKLLGIASRFGLGAAPFRDRVSLVAADGRATVPLHDFLAPFFGTREFHTNLRLAPRRPNSKPVVQIVSHDGAVLAFAKFGWDPLTQRLIRNEAETLRALAPKVRGSRLNIPEVIHSGVWNGLEVLIVSPLADMGHTPWGAEDGLTDAVDAVCDVGLTSRMPLADSKFWARISSEVERTAPLLGPSNARILRTACDWLSAEWGGTEVQLGRSHGDWIPPNISIRPDGTYNVWDWERSEPDVPVGLDVLQFILFGELRKTPSPTDLVARVEERGRPALYALGLNPDLIRLLAPLSLVRSLLWYGEAREARRGEAEDSHFGSALEAFCTAYHASLAPNLRQTDLPPEPNPSTPRQAGIYDMKGSSNEN